MAFGGGHASAMSELRRRLRSLERMRDALSDANDGRIPDPEDADMYSNPDEDDDYIDRPSLFSLPAGSSTQTARSSVQRRSPTLAKSVLARLETRLQEARGGAIAAVRYVCHDTLPGDILETIADLAVGGSTVEDAMCVCSGRELSFSWTPGSSDVLLRCAACEKIRCAQTASATLLSSSVAAFVDNPHFHIQGARATRHRMSRWHNFRTVILDEWLDCGVATYRVCCEQLFNTTVSIGCVGQHRATGVNMTMDWIPGHEPETAALVATSRSNISLASSVQPEFSKPALFRDGSR